MGDYRLLASLNRSGKLGLLLNLVGLAGLFLLIFDPSLTNIRLNTSLNAALIFISYLVFLLNIINGLVVGQRMRRFLSWHWMDFIIIVPMLVGDYSQMHPAQLILLRQILFHLYSVLHPKTMSGFSEQISARPGRIILISFIGIILAGTVLLSMPISLANNQHASALTGLFTATSAVCVTGLIVEDTGTYFSIFGQLVILLLIQLGGLGIMTLTAGTAVLVGKKMRLSQKSIMQNILDQTDVLSLKKLLKQILFWTFTLEFFGALILSLRFYQLGNVSLLHAIYSGVFHSISAFCNAGFSIYSDSITGFQFDMVINMVVMALITCGGLGFFVLATMSEWLMGNRKPIGMHHSKMVLFISLFLILFGTIAIFVLESENTAMQGLTFSETLLTSVFQSVTTRTAGFNSIDISVLRAPTLFFMMILMFIGASHGSTGGGIKTTTLGIMILAVWSYIKGESEVVFQRRTIPQEAVLKSFIITSVSIFCVVLFTLLLLLTEGQPILPILFETTSAFGTVGLSTGLTSQLSAMGRLLIIILMFTGRVGMLTIMMSIHSRSSNTSVRYSEARILAG